MQQTPKDEKLPASVQPEGGRDDDHAKTADSEMPAALTALKEDVSALREQLASMQETLHGVYDFIQRKDGELQRWRAGYDWVRQKSLISDLVDFAIIMRNRAVHLSGDARREWDGLLDVVEVSLENHGVEIILPRKGEKFDKWKGCAEISSAEQTQNRDEDGTICKVSLPGFWIQAGEDKKIVAQKARVTVWKWAPSAGAKEDNITKQQHEEK